MLYKSNKILIATDCINNSCNKYAEEYVKYEFGWIVVLSLKIKDESVKTGDTDFARFSSHSVKLN